jgi:hypothetical protein
MIGKITSFHIQPCEKSLISVNSNKNSKNIQAASSCGSPAATTFPAGNWAIETALQTISTNCTSNSATWRCYPYSTYSQSPSDSDTVFNWIIGQDPTNCGTYKISSTNNPFSIVFNNITLTLADAGLASERYTFKITRQKSVAASQAVSDNNAQATCYFNATTLQGDLYTRMERTYPANLSDSSNTTTPSFTTFNSWPYATEIVQLDSSDDIPQCFDMAGDLLGNFTVGGGGGSCECLYANFGL